MITEQLILSILAKHGRWWACIIHNKSLEISYIALSKRKKATVQGDKEIARWHYSKLKVFCIFTELFVLSLLHFNFFVVFMTPSLYTLLSFKPEKCGCKERADLGLLQNDIYLGTETLLLDCKMYFSLGSYRHSSQESSASLQQGLRKGWWAWWAAPAGALPCTGHFSRVGYEAHMHTPQPGCSPKSQQPSTSCVPTHLFWEDHLVPNPSLFPEELAGFYPCCPAHSWGCKQLGGRRAGICGR